MKYLKPDRLSVRWRESPRNLRTKILADAFPKLDASSPEHKVTLDLVNANIIWIWRFNDCRYDKCDRQPAKK